MFAREQDPSTHSSAESAEADSSSILPQDSSNPPHPYLVALCSVVLAAWLRFLFDPILGDRLPYAAFFFATILAGWYGGLGPGLLAIGLGIFSALWFFVPPRHSFAVHSTDNLIGLAAFALLGITTASFSEALRRARLRAEASAREALVKQQQLQAEVRERRRLDDERRRLVTLVENSTDFIALAAADGHLLYLNKAGRDLVGLASQKEVAATRLSDYWHPDTLASPYARSLSRPLQVQDVWLRFDGALMHLITGEPIAVDCNLFSLPPSVDGESSVLACCLRDIREQKRAEEAHASLAAIVQSSEDAIMSLALDGSITSWNEGAQRMFGYALHEIQGAPVTKLVPPERAEETQHILRAVRKGERVQHFQTERRAKDGQLVFVSLSVSPVRGSDGAIIGISEIARDITQQRAAEEALHQAHNELNRHAQALEARVAERTAELEARNKELESFCYTVSHDLRAPLRAMRGFAAALREDFAPALGEMGDDYTRRIEAASMRMDTLIQDLLAYGKLSQSEIPFASVALDKLLDGLLSHLESELARTQATVTVGRPMPSVRANSTLLEQILSNLILNAVKFVPPGVKPRVELSTELRGTTVRISVRDNGIGISAADQARVFDPFQRLHNEVDYPGTGIGLAIVRKGAERMSGQVGLESELGKGSCFWIELPRSDGLQP